MLPGPRASAAGRAVTRGSWELEVPVRCKCRFPVDHRCITVPRELWDIQPTGGQTALGQVRFRPEGLFCARHGVQAQSCAGAPEEAGEPPRRKVLRDAPSRTRGSERASWKRWSLSRALLSRRRLLAFPPWKPQRAVHGSCPAGACGRVGLCPCPGQAGLPPPEPWVSAEAALLSPAVEPARPLTLLCLIRA